MRKASFKGRLVTVDRTIERNRKPIEMDLMMKTLISGSTGLVGTALIASLRRKGHEVVRLVRKPAGPGEVFWDPAAGKIDAASLKGIEGVVHLAGENIAAGRWTSAVKRRIRESRVDGTSLLAKSLAALTPAPRVLVSASAIGYYGDRGGELLTEAAPPGTNFLAEVCVAWEKAARPAADAGIRVVFPRIGVVLSAKGGALAKMLLPFKLGVGGVVGPGDQYMSWIDLDDLVGVIEECLLDDSLAGPVNAVAPKAVTNREFTKALGRALHRPTIFPMPAFAARLAFGEMADQLLLASANVDASRIQKAGYAFQYPDIDASLAHAVG